MYFLSHSSSSVIWDTISYYLMLVLIVVDSGARNPPLPWAVTESNGGWGVLLQGMLLQTPGEELVKWEAFSLPRKLSDSHVQITEPYLQYWVTPPWISLKFKLQALVG